jgi:septation ring formation regulator EzrA
MIRFLVPLLAVLMLPLAASTQTLTKADAEKMVLGLYVIDVAVEVCDLTITREQEKRLEFWIEWAEKQLNISDRKLDKTYDTLEAEAKADKAAFCTKMTPVANEAMKELPATL